MDINNEKLYEILLTAAEIKLIHSMIEFALRYENFADMSQTEQEEYRILGDALDQGYRVGNEC